MLHTHIAGTAVDGSDDDSLAHVAAIVEYLFALRQEVRIARNGSTNFAPLTTHHDLAKPARRNRGQGTRLLPPTLALPYP